MGCSLPQGHSALTWRLDMGLLLSLVSLHSRLTFLYCLGRFSSKYACCFYVTLIFGTTLVSSPTSASIVLTSVRNWCQAQPLFHVANRHVHALQQSVVSPCWLRQNTFLPTRKFSDLPLHVASEKGHGSEHTPSSFKPANKPAYWNTHLTVLRVSPDPSRKRFPSSGKDPRRHPSCAFVVFVGPTFYGTSSGVPGSLISRFQLSRHINCRCIILRTFQETCSNRLFFANGGTPNLSVASDFSLQGTKHRGNWCDGWFFVAPFLGLTRSFPERSRHAYVPSAKGTFAPYSQKAAGNSVGKIIHSAPRALHSEHTATASCPLAATRQQKCQACISKTPTPSGGDSRSQPVVCLGEFEATGKPRQETIALRDGQLEGSRGSNSTVGHAACTPQKSNENKNQQNSNASEPKGQSEQEQPTSGSYHEHVPVMVNEVLQYLITSKDGLYIDCTAGGGGHAEAIWRAVEFEGGRLLAIDRDEEAVAATRNRMRQLRRIRVGCGLGDTRVDNGREAGVRKTENTRTGTSSSLVTEKRMHSPLEAPFQQRKWNYFEWQQRNEMDPHGMSTFGKGTIAEQSSVIVLQSSFADLPHALRVAMDTWRPPGTVSEVPKAAIRRRTKRGASHLFRGSTRTDKKEEEHRQPSMRQEDGLADRVGHGENPGEQQHTEVDLLTAQDPLHCIHRGGLEVAALYDGLEGTVDGIFADLGVSTHQLTAAHRGFSHSIDGPLDMRFERGNSSASGDAASATKDSPDTDPDQDCAPADETAVTGWSRQSPVIDGVAAANDSSSHGLENAPSGIGGSRGGNLDAAQVVNSLPQAALAYIFKTFGEERLAGPIASCIVRYREIHGLLKTTEELRQIIEDCCRYRNPQFVIKTCSRVFQALRMYVNQELESLDSLLTHAERLLKPGGRLVILSYHSLEDRLIKQRLKQNNKNSDWTTANSRRQGFFSRKQPTRLDPTGEFGPLTSAARGTKEAQVHQQDPRVLEKLLSDAGFGQETAKYGNCFDAEDVQRQLFGAGDTHNERENKLWHLVLKKPLKPKEEEVLRNRRARTAKMRVAAKLPATQAMPRH
ncbi:MraW methylase family protein [Toxoplasma gondii VEG]|uniref:MraW methylase family protein n=1 Tax=Toxoplasma gondii (strain ATCC 50861 / VEG) TaxID=432359 RepID=V4YSK3_TOXGV|nr:MraW methylase family protein [Toxoplasma gondii VEG]CEL77123.1 TPA: S-adenosyl-methyltransferase mraW, putative [Toxoplasma gondii VEG]